LHEIARIRAKERGKLDKLLQLIEKSKDSLKLFAQDGNPHYLLAEADYLSIPQQYHFVMFTYAKTSSGRAFSRHLPSFLLDAGYEGALRVELSYQVEIPEFVYIEAYKAVVM
jgi:deoxycytidine triphosphate deaminase